MSAGSISNGNVKQVVPFLRVSDMERSVRFCGLSYVFRKEREPTDLRTRRSNALARG
jgi:hypothetical protein